MQQLVFNSITSSPNPFLQVKHSYQEPLLLLCLPPLVQGVCSLVEELKYPHPLGLPCLDGELLQENRKSLSVCSGGKSSLLLLQTR